MQAGAPSPITNAPASGWPGRMILEAAFGGGIETPPDQLTWTVLSDTTASRGTVKRFWGWQDSSGVPYLLGQLQSSSGSAPMDNADGNLSPSNEASPYYPDVQTGTPLRLRCALGTVGGVAVNRWYVLQRNALEWDEKRNDAWRNYVDVSITDLWSAVAGACPSPYRGEIYQDLAITGTGWWWPLAFSQRASHWNASLYSPSTP